MQSVGLDFSKARRSFHQEHGLRLGRSRLPSFARTHTKNSRHPVARGTWGQHPPANFAGHKTGSAELVPAVLPSCLDVQGRRGKTTASGLVKCFGIIDQPRTWPVCPLQGTVPHCFACGTYSSGSRQTRVTIALSRTYRPGSWLVD